MGATPWGHDQRERLGPEPTTLLERLDHTLKAFDETPDDQLAVTATQNLYGPGVKTGVTWGDLRRLAEFARTFES